MPLAPCPVCVFMQTKAVTVTRMYSEDTVEERLRAVIARRSGTVATVSTAAAANAGEIKCTVGDYNELLKCDLEVDEEDESEDEEEVIVLE